MIAVQSRCYFFKIVIEVRAAIPEKIIRELVGNRTTNPFIFCLLLQQIIHHVNSSK